MAFGKVISAKMPIPSNRLNVSCRYLWKTTVWLYEKDRRLIELGASEQAAILFADSIVTELTQENCGHTR